MQEQKSVLFKTMAYDPYKALYIHIPFCKSRCIYCDFCTEAVDANSEGVRNYLDRLMLDLRVASSEGKLEAIETVYIGGGTPTHLGHDKLVELVYFLSTTLFMKNVKEFTIEANPESLTEEIVKDIYALGVNRISLGVQSFHDDDLKTLSRVHDAARAKEAVNIASSRFDNVSIDLMCGLPGQTLDDWKDNLSQASELPISHISIYPLTVEERTPLYKQCMRGKMPWPDDDLQADMMEAAAKFLTSKGFRRYEVASYAKPGFESKHNCIYWTGIPYIGFGTSAATMTQNDELRIRTQDGIVTDQLNRPQMEAEDLMLGMRMSDGVSDDRVNRASAYLPRLNDTFLKLIHDGLVVHENGRYRPTERGWLCGNELYAAIFDLA